MHKPNDKVRIKKDVPNHAGQLGIVIAVRGEWYVIRLDGGDTLGFRDFEIESREILK